MCSIVCRGLGPSPLTVSEVQVEQTEMQAEGFTQCSEVVAAANRPGKSSDVLHICVSLSLQSQSSGLCMKQEPLDAEPSLQVSFNMELGVWFQATKPYEQVPPTLHVPSKATFNNAREPEGCVRVSGCERQ